MPNKGPPLFCIGHLRRASPPPPHHTHTHTHTFRIGPDLKHPLRYKPLMVGYAMSPQITMCIHITFAPRIRSPSLIIEMSLLLTLFINCIQCTHTHTRTSFHFQMHQLIHKSPQVRINNDYCKASCHYHLVRIVSGKDCHLLKMHFLFKRDQ